MKNILLWALVALNAVLLASFLGRLPGNSAVAQPRMAVGSYLAVPGEVVGGGAGAVVYVFDTRNFILTAVQQTPRGVDVMAPLDLSQQFGRR
jgi:hypothetical protein